MRLDRIEQSLCFEIGDDFFTGDETVKSAIDFRSVFIDLCVKRENADRFETVTGTDGVIVEIMRRSDFHATGSEFLVDVLVGDDRDFTIGQRQFDRLADQSLVTFVFRPTPLL